MRRSSLGISLIVLVMLARLAPTYRTFSDTIDEPYHLGAGLCELACGHLIKGVQHPPLPRLIAALPVYLSGVRDVADQHPRLFYDDLGAFDVGHAALLHSSLTYWQVLTRARLAMLIFPIAAIVYTFLLGRWLSGPAVGLAAAAWLSTDPTFLGHAPWIATDVPAGAAVLAILFHGLAWLRKPDGRRTAIFGVVTGLALACKFTVLFALPPILLLVAWKLYAAASRERVRWVTQLFAAGLLGFTVFWGTYGFDYDTHGPLPAMRAGLAVLNGHAEFGHAAYLNGQRYQHSSMLYFPEAFALKSPVAVLIAIVMATFRKTRATARSDSLNREREIIRLTLLLALAIFVILAILSPLNLGIRHLLPAIVLIYPLLAGALRNRPRLLWSLIAISVIETAWVTPDYLSYFNVLAGGPSNGDRFLLDSNLDWAQDLERARVWLDQHAQGRTVSLNLFASPRLQQWPHSGYSLQPAGEKPRDLVLIDKNVEHGLYASEGIDAKGDIVRIPPLIPPPGAKPIATIGYSIDVFQIPR